MGSGKRQKVFGAPILFSTVYGNAPFFLYYVLALTTGHSNTPLIAISNRDYQLE